MRQSTQKAEVFLLFFFALFLSGAVAPPALAQSYTFQHFAGPTGGPGAIDGTGAAARFNQPWGIARDAAGNLYVSDSRSYTIRAITPTGTVTSFAGRMGSTGFEDGARSAARFTQPRHVTIDGSGNLYVADAGIHVIRKITPAAVVSTLAGTPFLSGTDDGTGATARFNYPSGIAFDAFSGSLYVTDGQNHTIRRVTLAGVVTTVAGLAGTSGSDNGTGTAARFLFPSGIATDSGGNIYVSDDNHTIRKSTPAGVVSPLAGLAGAIGSTNGPGGSARFYDPEGLTVDSSGNVYVADAGNNSIRKIAPDGAVTTLAGGSYGHVDDAGALARFATPYGVTVDGSGNVYVAEFGNCTIRRVTSAGAVSTLAGASAPAGAMDDTGAAARFNAPRGLVFDAAGNLYVADQFNSVVRKITSGAIATTFAGTVGTIGTADGTGPFARFHQPSGLGIDVSGNLYVADQGTNTIRKVTPAGDVTTLAGTPYTTGTTDDAGSAARFNQPVAVATDAASNIYVVDSSNHAIRRITPAGVVTTFAGLAGTAGSVNGTGTVARFYYPAGIARDSSGNFYVADQYNEVIRKITPAGVVTTFAGEFGLFGTTDGTGTAARFFDPESIAVDSSDNVYVGEQTRSTIRRITPAGVVTTIGPAGFLRGNEDGTGPFGRFSRPAGMAVDSSGRIYVADAETHVIRRGSIALNAAAAIDSSSGSLFVTRTLNTAPNPGFTWSWSVVRRPTGSTAVLSSASAPGPTFTPDMPDVYVFRLTTTGAASATSITDVSLNAKCPAVTIGPVSLAHPLSGVAYSQTISAAGGANPYVFTVAGGVLPPGLTLSTGGTLSGTSSSLGTYTFTVRATDTTTCSADRAYTITVSPVAAPASLVATWNGSSVAVTWSSVSGAAGYRVYRRTSGVGFTSIGTSITTSFDDTTVAFTGYVYMVRAYDGGAVESGDSNQDLMTAYPYETLIVGTTLVQGVHINELRTLINIARGLASLDPPSYTDPSLGGVLVKAVHVTQLRAALDEARMALGMSAVVYADPSLSGVPIKAVHINQLRDGMR